MPRKSTPSRKRRKPGPNWPPKPYPDFPLGPGVHGRWQKKIKGTIYYFGRWGRRVNGKLERIEGDGWQAALEEYERQKDVLHSGRTSRVKSNSLTVAPAAARCRSRR